MAPRDKPPAAPDKAKPARNLGTSRRVVATRLGYYDHRRRKPGDSFVLKEGEDIPSWAVTAEEYSRLTEEQKDEAQQVVPRRGELEL
jgi:hypothetical protein